MRMTVRRLGALATALALAGAACGQATPVARTSPPPTSAAPTPVPSPTLRSCVEPADQATAVQFSTAGGTTLHGAVLGGGEPGVVLAHQVDNTLCAWLPFARVLRDRGMRVLAFDFVKTDPGTADVAAAIAELQREGARRIVLVGASYGGTSCLATANQSPAVVAVVSVSSPASFEAMDATAAVRAMRVPVLFLASEQDTEYAADARTMFAAAAPSDKRLQIASGRAHGTQLANESDVQSLVLTWIQAHASA